jgi:gentisate 1,2-dioxygenase
MNQRPEIPLSNDPHSQRKEYYRDLSRQSIEALWNALASAAPREPRVASVPHIWKWHDIRPRMLRASDLVTPQEAERRVLMLINPAYDARSFRTVGLIFAGVQMILPGEIADTHRHTPNAQRFIIEGNGAYTTVNGERTIMSKGDFVMTPTWSWHDHGNESDAPMIWLDGLDLPYVNILEANFFEDYAEGSATIQPISKSVQDSHYRFGRNMRPRWEACSDRAASPLLNYRWADARDALHHLRSEAGSPFDGVILDYVNPLTGGPTLPTMAASLQLLRKDEHTHAHRHTSSTVYHVAEGRGRSIIAGEEFVWEEGDTFVVPSWTWHEHAAAGAEAVLFSYSDRPIIDAFGFYREESPETHYRH